MLLFTFYIYLGFLVVLICWTLVNCVLVLLRFVELIKNKAQKRNLKMFCSSKVEVLDYQMSASWRGKCNKYLDTFEKFKLSKLFSFSFYYPFVFFIEITQSCRNPKQLNPNGSDSRERFAYFLLFSSLAPVLYSFPSAHHNSPAFLHFYISFTVTCIHAVYSTHEINFLQQ